MASVSTRNSASVDRPSSLPQAHGVDAGLDVGGGGELQTDLGGVVLGVGEVFLLGLERQREARRGRQVAAADGDGDGLAGLGAARLQAVNAGGAAAAAEA